MSTSNLVTIFTKRQKQTRSTLELVQSTRLYASNPVKHNFINKQNNYIAVLLKNHILNFTETLLTWKKSNLEVEQQWEDDSAMVSFFQISKKTPSSFMVTYLYTFFFWSFFFNSLNSMFRKKKQESTTTSSHPPKPYENCPDQLIEHLWKIIKI